MTVDLSELLERCPCDRFYSMFLTAGIPMPSSIRSTVQSKVSPVLQRSYVAPGMFAEGFNSASFLEVEADRMLLITTYLPTYLPFQILLVLCRQSRLGCCVWVVKSAARNVVTLLASSHVTNSMMTGNIPSEIYKRKSN